MGLYTKKAVNEVLSNYEKFVLTGLEEKISIFYKFIYLFELDMRKISRKALISIDKELKNKDMKKLSEKELIDLREKYNISDVYLINKKGIIFKTSDKSDFGFNIFFVGEEFRDKLLKIFGTGKMFFERVDPAAQTGKFKLFSYYGPKGKNYLIETSINLNEYMKKRYLFKYGDNIIKDFFNRERKKLNYIISLDIYYRSKGKIWSIINRGKYSSKSDDFFEELKKDRILTIRRGDKIELWKRIDMNEGTFHWSAGKYINAVFDFSSIYKYRRRIIIFAIIVSTIVFILFYLLSINIVETFFLKRLLLINNIIKKIANGDYKNKIEIKGKDELTEISKNINKMATDIDRVMTQLKNNNKILEQKVRERTKELEYKNRSLFKLSKKLDQMARTDFLTGLSNRRAMIRKIQEEKVRYKRAKKPFVLILIDIDDFKNVNDTYGHDVGDEVLKRFSFLFEASVREQDFVSRWGGEEFLILLPDTDIKGGEILSEKIRKRIADIKIQIGDKTYYSLTITLGISVCNNTNKTMEQLLKEVDLALYKGKKLGKNCSIVFNKEDFDTI
jgi:diguanylate cyclase (GGDEF)-like protein